MELKNILSSHSFTFNKRFGQNFISDTNLLNAIVSDANVGKNDTVLEIGAGAGTLTKALSLCAKRVIAYEIDLNLKEVLKDTLCDCSNVEVILEDFMKTPMSLIDEQCGSGFVVVANLPYYITTPVLMAFVEQSKNVSSLTLMVQKEVAERLTAPPDCKEYGAVTVATQSCGKVTYLRTVPRTVFFPQPNVDSAVVRIDFCKGLYDIPDKVQFRKTVKAGFAMRRKTLRNNLSTSFGLSKDQAEQVIEQMGLRPDVRGETLSVAQYAQLAKLLAKANND